MATITPMSFRWPSLSSYPQSRRLGWWLLAIVVLALALRFYRLDGQSFWYDEGSAVVLAERDLPTIARDAAADIHPPLYYYLLHYWTGWFGQSEVAARSLSVLLGAALVGLTWALGREMFDGLTGATGALLLAVSPFAVYYSQEARMYTLAALMGAACFLATLRVVKGWERGSGVPWLPLLAYFVFALGALYTHYFAFTVPLAANLVVGLWVLRHRAWRQAVTWAAVQLVIAALFLPWLLSTLDAIRNWPAVSQPFTLSFLLADSLRVFSLGRGTPWALGAVLYGVVLLLGAVWPSGKTLTRTLASILYLAIPLLVMAVLSLRRPMYNPKFLLVALPPFALLVARGALIPLRWNRRLGPFVSLVLLAALITVAASGLAGYYFDPRQARDDYRGIARYITAAGRPGDGVLVNAPSQVEVFGLYYHADLPVYPLPRQRPPDTAATEAELSRLAQQHDRLFGLFWATNESDPQGIVEDWLGSHGYQAMDSWWGNLRLTLYASPKATGDWRAVNLVLGEQLRLTEARLGQTTLQAGDVLPVGLRWTAEKSVQDDLKVFVHLVGADGLIIGQRDAAPGGRPTGGWAAGETRDDNHGVLVPFGTPPGQAEVRVGLYQAATGQRLPLTDGRDYLALGQVTLTRPASPPPVEVFNLPYRSGAAVGDLTLLGYSFYKRGFDYAPDTPIHPGD
ncbi:MAG: glycosyltransferase family 39 protein, partial [Anaerolineae bacterium]|nr:glycosyltransferase family 39 protein [Anaerolineae bacterium]